MIEPVVVVERDPLMKKLIPFHSWRRRTWQLSNGASPIFRGRRNNICLIRQQELKGHPKLRHKYFNMFDPLIPPFVMHINVKTYIPLSQRAWRHLWTTPQLFEPLNAPSSICRIWHFRYYYKFYKNWIAKSTDGTFNKVSIWYSLRPVILQNYEYFIKH